MVNSNLKKPTREQEKWLEGFGKMLSDAGIILSVLGRDRRDDDILKFEIAIWMPAENTQCIIELDEYDLVLQDDIIVIDEEFPAHNEDRVLMSTQNEIIKQYLIEHPFHSCMCQTVADTYQLVVRIDL